MIGYFLITLVYVNFWANVEKNVRQSFFKMLPHCEFLVILIILAMHTRIVRKKYLMKNKFPQLLLGTEELRTIM